MFVHELVATQAEATPDAIAIVSDRPVTYGELNARANQLARRLG
jgi:non-ribosomal peptide synthetase component F